MTEDMVAESIVCGPDPERYVEKVRSYEEAGFTAVHVQQVGPDLAGFLDFWGREVEPRL